ncbi:MAG: hypothetical protein ACQ9MH_22415 [Nitrospinales bacterium]
MRYAKEYDYVERNDRWGLSECPVSLLAEQLDEGYALMQRAGNQKEKNYAL